MFVMRMGIVRPQVWSFCNFCKQRRQEKLTEKEDRTLLLVLLQDVGTTEFSRLTSSTAVGRAER